MALQQLATAAELSNSAWPWFTMDYLNDEGERIYVRPPRVTWPELATVKALILQDLARAKQRRWLKRTAYHAQRLWALERIEEVLGARMRQDPRMTLGEALAAWTAAQAHNQQEQSA